ncbi:MAG: DUF3426 domain-containing protein [Hyphomonadaceae bacterium]
MILVCPSCDTRYFADDSKIGKEGRRVRCATCGHAWTAKLQEEDGAPAPVEETGLTREQVERLRQTAQANAKTRAGPHAEFRAQQHAKRKRDRSRVVTIAWISAAVLFAGALGAAIIFRNEVANAFPKAASLYQLVGLDVNRFGLVLENVSAKRSFDGTTPVLTVTGAAVNKSEEAKPTPQLRVTLKDEGGNEVQTWTDEFAVPSLAPGERTEFTTRFEAPPVETYRLTVSFAEKDGAGLGAETNVEAPGGPEHEGEAEGHDEAAPHDADSGPTDTHAPEEAHATEAANH